MRLLTTSLTRGYNIRMTTTQGSSNGNGGGQPTSGPVSGPISDALRSGERGHPDGWTDPHGSR